MENDKKQALKEEVLAFLKQGSMAVISTVDADNKPHSAAIFYTVDNNFNFYFFTKSDSKKYTNLEDDNLASIVVYEQEIPRTVQAEGFASLETDPKIINEVTATLLKSAVASSPWYAPPIVKMEGGQLKIVKVNINFLRFGDFRNKTGHPENEIFEQIIP